MVGDQVADDPVALVSVPGPMDHSSRALNRCLELQEVLVEMPQHAFLERTPGLAQLLPVGHLRHDLGPLGPNRLGGMAKVVA